MLNLQQDLQVRGRGLLAELRLGPATARRSTASTTQARRHFYTANEAEQELPSSPTGATSFTRRGHRVTTCRRNAALRLVARLPLLQQEERQPLLHGRRGREGQHHSQPQPRSTSSRAPAYYVVGGQSDCATDYPELWPTDGREGGVPDSQAAGPEWIQIGTEGGFLPKPAVIPQQPITWNIDPTMFNVGNVQDHSLLLGSAERADVIVDFSKYAGKTLILYNDAPTAFPALDPRTDYFTGDETTPTPAEPSRPRSATVPTPAPSCRSTSRQQRLRRRSTWPS